MDLGEPHQSVFWFEVKTTYDDESILCYAALVPAYAAAASCAMLLLQYVSSFVLNKKYILPSALSCTGTSADVTPHQSRKGYWQARIAQTGSLSIFLYKSLRMVGVLALFVLTLYSATKYGWTVLNTAAVITVIYASALSCWNVLARAITARLISRHLSIVALIIFASYAYRDIWPLMTFTLSPADEAEGTVLWVKVALSIFVGVVEPLFEPYAYIPVDPKDPAPVASPEQTTSIASLLFYTFVDPIIWLGYRSKHVSFDQLPPLCDYDRVQHLIHGTYPYLDPFSGGKKENPLWSVMKAFRASFVYQALLLLLLASSRMASPIGTKQLLSYLENYGEGAIVKPWVWIAWLGIGPIASATCHQLYIFLSTRRFVRIEGIITSLVFDHALRIRLKAETSEAQNATQGPKNASDSRISEEQSSSTSPAGRVSEGSTAMQGSAVASTSSAAVSGSGGSAASAVRKDAKGKTEVSKKAGSKTKGKNLVGRINNLVTSDLANIKMARNFLLIFVLAPIQIILSMLFLYAVLGWSSFVGLAVMVILFPVPAWIGKRLNGAQKAKMKATDSRVQRVTEMMNALRMIKLFGWEHRVEERVSEKREEELGFIWKRKVLGLWNTIINYIIPLLHMVVTYATYTLLMKQELTASVVFSSIAAFNMLRHEMYRAFTMMPMVIQGYVALGRLSEFLHKTELLDEFDQKTARSVVQDSSDDHENEIGCGGAHFTWANEEAYDGTKTPSKNTFRLRVEDNLIFKRGCFNLITGPTGSGKTSVLMALLREMHYIPLSPDSWVNLPRTGGVAYAAQESWIQNETIRNNILFGSPYDEDRYTKVIYQCGLKRDIGLFDAGDATEVGEKGITLSGGQKARVTLARAIYSTAEILLLDDVLAALDVHTAKWVVNKCFKGDLVKGRTVILVTHNVALATPLADFVVSLGINGQIASQGSVSEILAKDRDLAEQLERAAQLEEFDEVEDEDEDEKDGDDTKGKPKDGKLVVAEEIQLGHVNGKSFMLFVGNLGGRWPLLFWSSYIIGLSFSELADVFEMWWLGWWARQYTMRPASEVSVPYYLGTYCLIVFGVIVCNTYGVILYAYASMRASRIVHSRLVSSLLRSTFRWLDVTPLSRVITRCTQDIQAVDGPIAQQLNYLTAFSIGMAGRLAAVIWYTPAFLAPAVFIAVFGGWLGQMYMRSQLSVKREMSNAKSPVLSVFTGAVAGLVSIRAYGAQQAFRRMTMERIDRYTRAARCFWNVNRWVGMRIDALSALFSVSLAFYLVYGTASPDPSIIGFVLAMAVSFSDQILSFVRMYNEWEVNGNSLERIQQYTEIEQEPEPKVGGTPPAYWPASGELRVEGLSARYSPGGPKVLQDVSFHVKAGERVGIVGRTGSGKSSLTLALLRCIYTEGTVHYDGVPTHTINLDALRSNVTIIPQVPELLTGTLRQNLDMFGEYDDATLNDALRAAGLTSLQRLADEHRLTLDTPVAGGGANLSVGQRQIVALARAIVRRSKLLVLDEATSAIDYETDAVIQESLRTELQSDVTVLTVAHRLQTIMDSDKIMVLDAGRLVEFDSPRVLLQNEKSFLRALVEESADREALYAMVKGSASEV